MKQGIHHGVDVVQDDLVGHHVAIASHFLLSCPQNLLNLAAVIEEYPLDEPIKFLSLADGGAQHQKFSATLIVVKKFVMRLIFTKHYHGLT